MLAPKKSAIYYTGESIRFIFTCDAGVTPTLTVTRRDENGNDDPSWEGAAAKAAMSLPWDPEYSESETVGVLEWSSLTAGQFRGDLRCGDSVLPHPIVTFSVIERPEDAAALATLVEKSRIVVAQIASPTDAITIQVGDAVKLEGRCGGFHRGTKKSWRFVAVVDGGGEEGEAVEGTEYAFDEPGEYAVALRCRSNLHAWQDERWHFFTVVERPTVQQFEDADHKQVEAEE